MADYLLGIDFGTGGTKASLIETEGNELGYAFREYPILTPHPGWSEHDPNLYWKYTCEMISEIIKKSSVSAESIRGIAVSSALPSLVMVDSKGKPVENAYNLMDRRATAEVEYLKETVGEDRIFNITKNRLDDHPIIVNLLWEKKNRPESFKRVYKALTIDGFINLKLTGKFTTHLSAAPFYGVAYDIIKREFNEEILDTIGIDKGFFPELYRCEAVIGEVTEKAAKETGLRAGIPVAAGQVDCNAGWIGAGAINVGDIQMNLGTCGNFGIIHSNPAFHKSMIAFPYTTDSENIYITVPTTTTGGQLIRYMRDNFYKHEKKSEKDTGIDTYDLINKEAENIPPGSEGLIVLPFLMGERTPIWDVYARGTIFGISLNHTRGHFIKAMMESVAYALYDSFRIIRESGFPVNPPIILNEGGAKSNLWRKIITDVFNVPTAIVKRRSGAPFGDAVLAGVAVGIFKDFSVAKDWAEYINPMEPDIKNHKIYMEYFKLYKEIYNDLKTDFRKLAELRDRE